MSHNGLVRDKLVIVNYAPVSKRGISHLIKLFHKLFPRYRAIRAVSEKPSLDDFSPKDTSGIGTCLREFFPDEDVFGLVRYLHDNSGRVAGGVSMYPLRTALVRSDEDIYDSKDGDTWALSGSSLHELGHLNGLSHHVAKVKNCHFYCPMIDGRDLVQRDGLVGSSDHLRSGSTYCKDCLFYLRKKEL